ncbi:MAG: fructose-6-phosphate aldolase [Phycisphaerales bacterium]|nr:fructose-6-phosphate aldolase [Phycisphaerales bacterium]MCB9862104.1 fructose-6-phosphate aldolase [Phycisphaerales bacterium]
MKFFIDTANIDEIKSAADMGLLDGVTTNPSLVAKEGREFKSLIAEICEIVPGPVSAEVVSTDCDGMMKEARELIKIADNIVVKLPTITEGVKALHQCTAEGIKTNLTLVFQPLQAMIVAKAGATFVSPFLGRLDDIGQESMDVLADIRTIYDNYGFRTEILAASLRHPMHVLQAAKLGADIGTIPYKVITQLLHHPLTDIGLEKFLADWNKTKK